VEDHPWEHEAENWLGWARTPGHDAYWYYRDVFFDRLLPPAGARTLEVGCGEGRVTRDLTARAHNVTAVDISLTLVRHACAASTGSAFAVADGASLPFPSSSFDFAVAYNSLQVVDDVPRTVEEISRTLAPGSPFGVCVTHPTADVGMFLNDEPDSPYVVRPSYFESSWVDDTIERGALTMRFTGWTHSLEDYSRALEQAGMHITAIREPQPRTGSRYDRYQRVPMFLFILAVKT
jgi:ubiquinone/menaquinone biosynthesis C-methylase UbiE